jgi:2'-5' RNA ligase
MNSGAIGVAASETALILPVRLPIALEKVRRRGVGDAARGLPAHVTLLYPFVPPEGATRAVRARAAAVLALHASFTFGLTGQGLWPEILYAVVEPERPFRSMQADLAAAFPACQLYGGAFPFVPHVTVAQGEAAGDPHITTNRAWASLPATFVAGRVELIVRDGSGWRPLWRFPLVRR